MTKIYWSFNQVPELAEKSASERADAIKRVSNLCMKHWEWWSAVAVAAAFAGAGAWFGGRGLSGVVGAGIGGAIGGGFHQVTSIYVARKYYASLLAGHA